MIRFYSFAFLIINTHPCLFIISIYLTIIMKIHSSHHANQAIDLIIAKGAQYFQNQRLKSKISHITHQSTKQHINNYCSSSIMAPPQTEKMKKIQRPSLVKRDNMTPNKVKLKKNISTSQPKKHNSSREESLNGGYSSNMKSTNKPNICIKFLCRKVSESEDKESILRNLKEIQEEKNFQSQRQTLRNQRKMKQREKKLKEKIEELNMNGIPISFDDEGQLIAPEEDEEEKKKPKWKKKKPKKKQEIDEIDEVVKLKYSTIDFDTRSSINSQIMSVTGKKKGFTSSNRYYKKPHLSNDDYNNNDERQDSVIPFLNLNEGVRCIEHEKNITAQKTKLSQYTRQQFIKENKKTCFKSFMPDAGDQISAISMQTRSLEKRPMTSEAYRTKRTLETKWGNETRKSILWRPSTSKKSTNENKINVNNIELVKQITYL